MYPADERTGWLLQEEVFTIGTLDSTGDFHIVGCATVIAGLGRQAICLSAAHIFEGIYDLHAPPRAWRYNFPGAEQDKLFDLTPWIESKKIKALCVIDGVAHLCDVGSVCVLPPLDTALIVVEMPEGNPATFRNVLGVNSDPLPVGAEVILISYSTQTVSRISEHTFNVTRSIAIRRGQIAAVEITGTGLIRVPVYRTSIPTEAGMSGGPVFLYDASMVGPKQVCGIVSADMSVPGALQDPETDGDSVVSPVWPSAALNVRGQNRELITLKDLAARGAVKDFGAALRSTLLETSEDGTWRVTLGAS